MNVNVNVNVNVNANANANPPSTPVARPGIVPDLGEAPEGLRSALLAWIEAKDASDKAWKAYEDERHLKGYGVRIDPVLWLNWQAASDREKAAYVALRDAIPEVFGRYQPVNGYSVGYWKLSKRGLSRNVKHVDRKGVSLE